MASQDVAQTSSANGSAGVAASDEERPTIYERKDDAYFGYYAQLSHQAQMLQDAVRTGVYQRAILGNAAHHFRDKLVIDVGSGNGILALFSLQAGSKKVYAVEASNMVECLQDIAKAARGQLPGPSDLDERWYLESQGQTDDYPKPPANAWIGERLVPVHSKMEDVTTKMLEANVKVDTIVSECLGVLLVHERMCESFLDARDRFLKPGGALFPSSGTICFAPIEDKLIWDETANKARFWQNVAFHDVDLTPFFTAAWREGFSSPVVGCFSASTLMASSVEHLIDFETISMEEIRSFEIPLHWTVRKTGLIHGIGGWFDLAFQPSVASTDADAKMEGSEMHVGINDAAYSGMSGSAPAFEPSSDPAMQATSELLAAAAAANGGTLPGFNDDKNTSFMSTSPYCTSTHWQQARLLFPEPLAINRGQTLAGLMKFKVNNHRSYDIEADICIADAPSGIDPRMTRRRWKWMLDKQVYSWTTSSEA